MYPRARDRCHVHNGTLGCSELVEEPARKHDRGEEIHAKYMIPDIDRGVDRREALATFRLGRNRRVVDKSVELAGIQPLLDLDNGLMRSLRVREIDLNVVLRSHFPWAVFGEGVSRARDDAPASGGETLYSRVPDAAACSGEQEGAALLVGMRCRHAGGFPTDHVGSRIEAPLAPRHAERGTAELHPIMQAKGPILPELRDQGQQAITSP